MAQATLEDIVEAEERIRPYVEKSPIIQLHEDSDKEVSYNTLL